MKGLLEDTGMGTIHLKREIESLESNKQMRKIKVYIAGPYTHGDVAVNVRNAIDAAEVLFSSGFVPYVPHLTHFWHMIHHRPYEDWLSLDNEWLPCCDCVFRLAGESSGADAETELAFKLGKLVFTSIEGLIHYYKERCDYE